MMMKSTTSTTSTNNLQYNYYSESQHNGSIRHLLERRLSCIIQNWQLQRLYPAGYVQRIEGYTEQWGYNNTTNGPNAATNNKKQHWSIDSYSNDSETILFNDTVPTTVLQAATKLQNSKEINIIHLVQFHPAWMEQLLFRILNIHYIVRNSNYAVTEATGPLPYIQIASSLSSSLSSGGGPIMIGRYQQQFISPATTTKSTSAILQYILQNPTEFVTGNNVSVDDLTLSNNKDEELRTQSIMLKNLIETILQPNLIKLRYSNTILWEQLYKPQVIMASGGVFIPSSSHFHWKHIFYFSWFSLFQSWSERIQSNHVGYSHHNNNETIINDSIHQITKVYDIFEQQIIKSKQQRDSVANVKPATILGTNSPTIVDILLYDHLMQALNDYYLVIVLADYPNLIQFVQSLWIEYFSIETSNAITNSTNERPEVILQKWNHEQNAINPFTSFPLFKYDNNNNIDEIDNQNTATLDSINVDRFMLSLRNDGKLYAMLQKAKRERIAGSNIDSNEINSWNSIYKIHNNYAKNKVSTLYRWRMGDSYYPSDLQSSTKHATAQQQQQQQQPSSSQQPESIIRREYRRNDEIWISSIIASSVGILLAFGLAGYESSSSSETTTTA